MDSSLQRMSRGIYGEDVYEGSAYLAGGPVGTKKAYWWVFGYTEMGKPVLLLVGSAEKYTEEDALSKGAKLNEARAFNLNTKNQSKAVREIRATLLDEGAEPDDVLKRMLHDKGIKREEDKQQDNSIKGMFR